jgi:hypothetical protein
MGGLRARSEGLVITPSANPGSLPPRGPGRRDDSLRVRRSIRCRVGPRIRCWFSSFDRPIAVIVCLMACWLGLSDGCMSETGNTSATR